MGKSRFSLSDFFLFLLGAFFLCALDQATKFMVRSSLKLVRKPIYVFSWLNWEMVWNKGISFGLFHQGASGQRILLWLTIFIALIFLVAYFKTSDLLLRKGILLIVGGAFGNIKDRFQHQAVFDFIDVHWGQYHFPVFNVADIFISIGVMIILWKSFLRKN